MPCPHSSRSDASPQTCSICLCATVRVVKLSRTLIDDLVPVVQITIDGAQLDRSDPVSIGNDRAARANTGRKFDKRFNRCSACGKLGHKRRDKICGEDASPT
jgi:hypothetical protein